jgi:hypothetical protein
MLVFAGSFADGGVVANNPTMAAIAFLERAYGVHRSNIAVLSLGCGSVTGPVDVGKRAGGLFWALPLISQVSRLKQHVSYKVTGKICMPRRATGVSRW